MIYKQGDKYEETTEGQEGASSAPVEKKRSWLRILWPVIIGGIVACIFITFLAVVLQKKPSENPTDPAPSSNIVEGGDDYWAQFDEAFTYTSEERALLRAWGYTGDEIEDFQLAETPADQLVAESKQAQEEARATLSNPESPEYRALLDSTWLGQPSLTLPTYVEGVTEGEVLYNSHKFNADYDKVPAHGSNLFLKVYMPDGSHTFMECPLVRYMQLADSGNIVVQYQTASIGGSVIVYNMTEVVVQ